MSTTTPRFHAPLLAAAQAQKHVTHNEALALFDALVCARFLDRDLSAPPSTPADGDTYLVKATATGDWSGYDDAIASALDGAWRFYTPFTGLVAYVADEQALIVYTGSTWVDYASVLNLQNVPLLGVNAAADSTNKLAVASSAILLTNIGAGIQAKLNKHAGADTASLLYQTDFSGRAEMGLAGDDDFHIKVSADGASWHDALQIAAASGSVVVPSADINGGTVDGATLGATTPASAAVTTLTASGAATLSPAGANVTLSPTGSGRVIVAPATAGTLDNMVIGGTTPKAGSFASLQSGPSPFTAVAVGAASANLQLASTGSSSSASILRLSANSNPPFFTLGKSRAAAIGSFAAVQSGDVLGKFDFAADDGSSYATVAAEVRAIVAGSVSSGNVPANLGLWVMSGGTLTEMLHIASAGDMTLATAGGVQAHIVDTATAVDYVTLTGSAAGSPGVVTLGAGGSDTNIDIALTPKGSGAVRLPTAANGSVATALTALGPSGAHTTVQEWIAVKNAAGTVRYIPAF